MLLVWDGEGSSATQVGKRILKIQGNKLTFPALKCRSYDPVEIQTCDGESRVSLSLLLLHVVWSHLVSTELVSTQWSDFHQLLIFLALGMQARTSWKRWVSYSYLLNLELSWSVVGCLDFTAGRKSVFQVTVENNEVIIAYMDYHN